MWLSLSRLILTATGFAAGTLYAVATTAGAGPVPGAERVTPVLAAPLADLPGRRLTAAVVDYAPGGLSLRHRHDGSVFAYVLSGSIESQNSATGPLRIFRQGQAFFEPVGSTHTISRNASKTSPARLLAVFVAADNATLTRVLKGKP